MANELELGSGIKIPNPAPVDARYMKPQVGSAPAQPYVSDAEACALNPLSIRYDGLTVNVNGVDKCWRNADLSNAGLQVKFTSGGDAALEGRVAVLEQHDSAYAGLISPVYVRGAEGDFSGYPSLTDVSAAAQEILMADAVLELVQAELPVDSAALLLSSFASIEGNGCLVTLSLPGRLEMPRLLRNARIRGGAPIKAIANVSVIVDSEIGAPIQPGGKTVIVKDSKIYNGGYGNLYFTQGPGVVIIRGHIDVQAGFLPDPATTVLYEPAGLPVYDPDEDEGKVVGISAGAPAWVLPSATGVSAAQLEAVRTKTTLSATKAADYTLLLTDSGNIIPFSAAASCIIPEGVFPVGVIMEVMTTAAVVVTVGGAAGVSLLTTKHKTDGTAGYSLRLVQVAANQWVIQGGVA